MDLDNVYRVSAGDLGGCVRGGCINSYGVRASEKGTLKDFAERHPVRGLSLFRLFHCYFPLRGIELNCISETSNLKKQNTGQYRGGIRCLIEVSHST